MKDENFKTCLAIAQELDDVIDGKLYKCPHCGNTFNKDDTEETEEDGDSYYICPHCKEKIEEADFEPITLYDYFSDAYDIDFIVNYRKEYQSIRITVATGGPSIWIDTDRRAVCLAWWGETAQASLLSETCNAIDEYGEQLYAEY